MDPKIHVFSEVQKPTILLALIALRLISFLPRVWDAPWQNKVGHLQNGVRKVAVHTVYNCFTVYDDSSFKLVLKS